MWNRNKKTICAVSTPHGTGGIAVIRVSGSDALKFVKKISKKLNSKTTLKTHTVYYADIHDLSGEKVDDVIITYFAEGKSFTGDEVLEISCHGSTYITTKILEVLLQSGCVTAEKGEFTFRAFMNGKLDLVQAESVLSLIESQGEASAKLALRQLDGQVSDKYEKLISLLTWCLAHIEASIDFSSEGIDVVDNDVLIEKLKLILSNLEQLIKNYQNGRLLKDGVHVALLGAPNVGKSSLLNLLLQDEKAIVADVAGTTRDIVQGDLVYSGVKLVLSDTAGLRQTEDKVERIGIDRSIKQAHKADILCYVLPAAPEMNVDSLLAELPLSEDLKDAPKVILLNKADLLATGEVLRLQSSITNKNIIVVSAMNIKDRVSILDRVLSLALPFTEVQGQALISSVRQLEQTEYSFEMISKSIVDLEKNTGAEFVAMYLKEALISLQKILGQVYDDQIMDRVFKEFCLGK